MRTLEVELNVLFIMLWQDMATCRLVCLNKSMGAREWNVVVGICLAQGVALLGGVALLEEVCHCGGGL